MKLNVNSTKLVFFHNYYRTVDEKFVSGQIIVYLLNVNSSDENDFLDSYTISFWEDNDLFFSKDISVNSFNDVLKEVLSVCDNYGMVFEICY